LNKGGRRDDGDDDDGGGGDDDEDANDNVCMLRKVTRQVTSL
jgi:hypothetical protein